MKEEFSGIERRLERLSECLNKLEPLRKRLGEANILPMNFAKSIAPMAGFRNILINEYLGIDWNEVYRNLQRIDELYSFADHIKKWIKKRIQ